MKILVLVHEFPPVGGGGGHVAKDLCEGLSALGHEVKVLTADLFGGVSLDDDLADIEYDLLRVPSLRKDLSRASLAAMSSYIVSSVINGYILIRNWQPDVMHVHFAVPSGPVAWVLSKITGVPYVLTVHLGDVPGGTPEKTGRWFRVVKPFTFPIWNGANQVVAVSQFTRDLAKLTYQVPIRVIHNGVDISNFKSGPIQIHNPPRLVFAGRFVPQKNPLTVIQILHQLKYLDWSLVMLGAGKLFEQVKEKVEHHQLENRITMPGWVTPEEVKKEFQRSDILFMPSLSEGLPVVGVQALASGLAIIVSDIGGFSDLVIPGENGYLCDPNNIESFLSPLEELLGDPNRLLEFRQTSLKKAKDFDLARIVKMYEDELRIVAEDGSF